jgi:MFS family permease
MERSVIRLVLAGTLAVVVGLMPAFLLGANAVFVREDLGFSPRVLGFIVGLYFGALALTSLPAGALADRVGPRRLLLGALAGSAVGAAGITFLTPSTGWLMLWMILAGVSGGITLPAASLALVRGNMRGGGIAFGVQQSAVPATALLGGLAIPIVSITIGWRWTFLFGVGLAPIVVWLLPRPDRPAPRLDRAGGQPRLPVRLSRPFYALAIASGMASAAAIATSAFFVEAAVDRGATSTAGGMLLAMGGGLAIATRLYVGHQADRGTRRHLVVVAALLVVGALGQWFLSLAGTLPLLAVGMVLAYGIGYGWPGLLFHGVSKLHPSRPGSAIGTVNAGGAAGAAMGPPLFGMVASQVSDRAAWTTLATLAAMSAVIVFLAAEHFDQRRSRA